jgi:simple sugar transport system ATP-binding protein
VLVPHEVEELFASLRGLTEAGSTVIFISHKLDEVLRHADAITVIRAGRTVAEVADPSTVTARQLGELMVGSELPRPETPLRLIEPEVRLEVRRLAVQASDSDRLLLDHVSLQVHTGEIVGIAGVEGNGQTELIEAIMGLRRAEGQVTLRGTDLAPLSTLERRALGLGYVPEDRQRDGLVLTMPLWENAMLGHQAVTPFSTGVWIDRTAARSRTAAIIGEFGVRTTGPDVPAFTLSGGNQQKLIVGREMTAEPSVLVAANPTRGVDVGAQAVIWDMLRDARDRGLATLLVSADLEELLGLSDRLLVMLRGRIVAELDPRAVTAAELGTTMTGARS